MEGGLEAHIQESGKLGYGANSLPYPGWTQRPFGSSVRWPSCAPWLGLWRRSIGASRWRDGHRRDPSSCWRVLERCMPLGFIMRRGRDWPASAASAGPAEAEPVWRTRPYCNAMSRMPCVRLSNLSDLSVACQLPVPCFRNLVFLGDCWC